MMEKEYDWSKISLAEIRRRLYASTGKEALQMLEQVREDPRKGLQAIIAQYIKWLEKQRHEKERLWNMWERERELSTAGYSHIGGIDEAGRGPLAGPVVAACVILPSGIDLPKLNDSKQLTPQERTALSEIIKREAVAWSIGVTEHQEIDQINILQATKKAMIEAIDRMAIKPDYLLIDAVKIPTHIPQDAIIHGDALSASIAAASILAKTYRDSLMEMMDVLYPEYGFKEHKGYGTARHLEALARYGPTPIHRVSFLRNIANIKND